VEASRTPDPHIVAVPEPAKPRHESCDSCGALVERDQRYCVSCGAHRRHVHDPAGSYLAKTTARSRASARAATAAHQGKRRARTPGLGTALVFAAIPLAVGLGVLVGRASNNGDAKLLAALKAQKPEVISGGGGTGGAAVSAGTSNAQAVAALKSDFPYQSGYSVQLQTLPAHGTDRATVDKAEHGAESKGAKHVGLIVASAFQITPAPTGAGYLIYSGAYKAKADAEKALSALRGKFSSAKVIQIQPVGSGSPTTSGKVLAKTAYGTAHQITGFKVTKKQLQAGGQIVKKIQQEQGKSYINAQRNLPDQISVP
jgi:hypothetical protein